MQQFRDILNVGRATERYLIRLGFRKLEDLRGKDADTLWEQLNTLNGVRNDPCVRDVFAATIAIANGEKARPWWEFSRERKAREAKWN